jgi:hypothetical protein
MIRHSQCRNRLALISSVFLRKDNINNRSFLPSLRLPRKFHLLAFPLYGQAKRRFVRPKGGIIPALFELVFSSGHHHYDCVTANFRRR